MLWFKRNKMILAAPTILVVMAGGWLYANRPKRIDMAAYVPGAALAFLEINDWPQVLDQLTSTTTWRELAPRYGISDKLMHAGRVGWLAKFGGGGEAGLLARSQFALVVTGLEVRGDEVKPHLALIAETHTNADTLQKVAEARLPKFAENAFGKIVKATTEHSGVKITSYRAARSNRGLHSAQIDSELILANEVDALVACIDTRLARASSMMNNFYLQNSRPIVERDGSSFGFVTGEGVTRFLRFGAYLISGGVIGKAALAGAVGEVFTEFSTRTSDGIAYGASFENGEAVDRYALLFKPELVDKLKATIKPSGKEARAFGTIPVEARNVTLISVENPIKTLDGIEAAISSRVGAAQSFLLHQFVIGAREVFFGLGNGSKAEDAIGDEIASFDLGPRGAARVKKEESPRRVWMVAARNPTLMLAIVQRAMMANRATLIREKHRGIEILSSGDATRGSAAIMDDFLILGRYERLTQIIDLLASGQNLKNAPHFVAAGKFNEPAAIKSYDWAEGETAEMMATIASWLNENGKTDVIRTRGESVPLAVSATRVIDQGILVESHSPFGNIPSVVSLVAEATNAK